MASQEEHRKRIREAYGEKPRTMAYVTVFLILAALIIFTIKPPGQIRQDDQAQLKRFSSLEELKSFLNASQQEYGYGYSVGDVRTMAAEAAAPSAQKAADDYSTTNVQVTGVDEADIVKNDGKYIYAVSGDGVVIVDAYPAEGARIVSIINLSSPNSRANAQRIYINGDRLVVFGSQYDEIYPVMEKPAIEGIASRMMIRPYLYYPRTFIRIYDVSDRANPVLKRDVELNGTYHESRMIGDYVYAIVTAPAYYGRDAPLPLSAEDFPDVYYFDVPDYSYQFTHVLSVNVKDDAADAENKIFLLGYSSALFVSRDNIYMVYQKRVKQSYFFDRLVDDVMIPPVPKDVADKIRQIRDSGMPYYEKRITIEEVLRDWLESLNPEEAAPIMRQMEEKAAQIQKDMAKEMDKSVVHKISISNGRIEYRTRGEVPGQPLNQFSMDEHDGYFRIATTTGSSGGFSIASVAVSERVLAAPPEKEPQTEPTNPEATVTEEPEEQTTPANPEPSVIEQPQPVPAVRPRAESLNHLYVLDSDMNIVGKVEDLALGERIYSARFIGDRAYLVTFVRIDPLFVIDLGDPRNPRVLGELKIPGVSDYLHPYDETHIIGVGRSAEDLGDFARFRGLKLSLFDVSDVSSPKEVAKYEIGERGTDSEALYDHKAFLFSKQKSLLAIPVTLAEKEYKYSWQGAYILDVTPESGFQLKGKVTHDEAKPDETYYYPRYPVRRSMYIGDVLYTISEKAIKANSLAGLKEINRISLPGEQQVYYPL